MLHPKVVVSVLRLADLVKTMPEHEALTFMSRCRQAAINDGYCVTRVISAGKVEQQNIWRYA